MAALDLQRLGHEGRCFLQIAFQKRKLCNTVENGADEQRVVQDSGQGQGLLEQRKSLAAVPL